MVSQAVARFERAYADWKVGAWYEGAGPVPINRWRFALEWARDASSWGVRRALCARLGHRVAAAGPDGGGEFLECTRCGWSHDVIYY